MTCLSLPVKDFLAISDAAIFHSHYLIPSFLPSLCLSFASFSFSLSPSLLFTSLLLCDCSPLLHPQKSQCGWCLIDPAALPSTLWAARAAVAQPAHQQPHTHTGPAAARSLTETLSHGFCRGRALQAPLSRMLSPLPSGRRPAAAQAPPSSPQVPLSSSLT
jgi:hypothetical protein